ncbi:C1 family peptidase [Vibrio sp. HN007]|uniref:C1 family peptidase n=1 Tax=Vibrio iocasae TaxID=3098914 RepID=UPI0035D450E2
MIFIRNRWLWLFLSALPFFSLAKDTTFTLGGEFDIKRYKKVSKIPPLARGDYDDIPTQFSLKRYAPSVGNQGSSGSCVGWSTGYAARSILYNKWADKSQPKQAKKGAFSPAWVFNQVKLSDNCEGGSYISDALKLLADKGALQDTAFPYSENSCYRIPTQSEFSKANDFKIEHFRRLSSSYSSSSIAVNTRKALARGNPVVIGMAVGDTFMRHRGRSNVSFSQDDYQSFEFHGMDDFGGHAMTVVGYDDNYKGGSFEIINSWGTDWGNKGYFWLSYEDYQTFVFEAYELIGPKPYVEPPPVPKPNFFLEANFIHFDGSPLLLSHKNERFHIKQPLGSGERIRAQLKLEQDSYVYVIGADKSTSDHAVLFPHKEISSPYIGKGETLLLPGPTEAYFSQLNRTEGEDYFIILTSTQQISIDEVARKMSTLAIGTPIQKRLSAALGDTIVIPSLNKQLARGYLKNNQVMATVVSLDHTAPRPMKSENNSPQIVFTYPEPEAPATTHSPALILTTENTISIVGAAQDQSLIKEVSSEQALQTRFSSRGAFKLKFDLSELEIGKTQTLTVKAVDEHGNAKTAQLNIRKQAEQPEVSQ